MDGGRHNGWNWTRRELLRKLAGAAALTPFARRNRPFALQISGGHPPRGTAPTGQKTLSDQDDAFLQEIEAANFRYFWEQTNPDTGIVRDRCNVRIPDKSDLGSIAATGFGINSELGLSTLSATLMDP
jgi:hypothetical protein